MNGQLKQILVAVDNSPFALTAARWGAYLAQASGATLTLVHVVEVRLTNAPFFADISGALGAAPFENVMESVLAAMRERGRNILSAAAEMAQQHGATATTRLEHGVFTDTLIELSAQADLLVLGRRGESAAHGRFLIGHEAERVVRHATCSCLVVPADFAPPQSLLVGVHDSARAQAAGAWAAFLRERLGSATIRPLHVREAQRPKDWSQERVAGVPVEVRDGDPEAVIVAACNEAPQQTLCLLGATGHSRTLKELFLGTMPFHVLHHTRGPVLIAR